MSGPLLSIDVDAHLEKLATRTYRSPAHYPVELVRSALKRGAEKIDIQTGKRCFEIRDNGRPLEPIRLQLLRSLLDPSVSDRTREQAVIDLQDPGGIGLLAIFSSSPTRIEVSSAGPSAEHRLLFYRGSVQQFESRPLKPGPTDRHFGTRISLLRKGSNIDEENRILREYCRGVSKEIRVNQQPVSGKPLIPNALVSKRLIPGPVGISGEVGIPVRGDVCRIWFLDQGIPLSRKIIAPWKGFIFDAALEFSGEITGRILNDMLGDVTTLYRYLIDKFQKFPPEKQARIEELVFRHHLLSQSRLLVDVFPVFYSLSDRSYLTLPQVEKLAEKGAITVIPEHHHPPVDRDLEGVAAFRLNEQQIDTLANRFDIPIQFLQPVETRRDLRNAFLECRERLKKKIDRILANGRDPVPAGQLDQKEKEMIRLLEEFLNPNAPHRTDQTLYSEIRFIAARGLSPFVALNDESSLLTRQKKLRIQRYHPLVKKAVRAIGQDPKNIELLRPLLD